MQKWKKFCCALLMAAGAILLGGCGQNNGGENSSAQQPGAEAEAQDVEVGESLVYGETSLALPEGVECVYDIRVVQEQTLLVTDQGLYRSPDQGDTWEKSEDFPASEYKAAAIGPSGEVALCDKTESITVWKQDGSTQEVRADFSEDQVCYTLEFLSDDRLLVTAVDSSIQVVDIAGDKIMGTVSADNGYHLLECAVGGRILVWNLSGDVQIFDEAGENPEPCELAEQLFKQSENAGLGLGNYGVLAADTENTGFFYAGARGLYHYMLGGSVTEQLIDGEQTAMGDNNYRIENLAPLSDGGFLAVYMDNDSMSPCLKRYRARTAQELENRVELTVYTLYDNEMLRQEINVLMQANPDYLVSLEVGVDGTGGVTAEDAIKTLNTEIMAGGGPDLIMMDGISVEPYIEKGILTDLSDVVEQVDEAEGLARNITDTYASGDEIQAVPLRFAMPIFMGKQEDLESITDLASLAECVQRLKAENPERTSVLGKYGRTYLEILFDICGPAWITEEGVEQEKLQEFLETAKKMQEIQQEGISQEDIDAVTEISDFYSADNGEAEGEWMSQVSNGVYSLGLIYSKSLNVSMIMLTSEQSFDFARGQSSHVFVPQEIIGVNAAGDHVEQAKNLVRDFLFGVSQSQFVLTDNAYPVNKTALNGQMEDELNAGERLESWLENTSATEEDIREGLEKIVEMTGELDTCAVNDDIVREIVLEQGLEYLNGQKSLEQAVNGIMQGLELRMAE